MKRLLALLTVAVVAGLVPVVGGGPSQSRASFEAAIHNATTAPPYVLIDVVDESSKNSQTICTTVNLLMGAIHREYGLEYDEAGQARAKEIALSNTAHVFKFSKRAALSNI